MMAGQGRPADFNTCRCKSLRESVATIELPRLCAQAHRRCRGLPIGLLRPADMPRGARNQRRINVAHSIGHHVMPNTSFLTDIQTLRKRARQHIDEGSVTAGYSADREIVLKLLNNSLATELVCVLRYRRHHFMARGIHSQSVAQEFLDHSNEELGHADEIAERIVQLGGAPDFNPDGLSSRSHAEYVEAASLSSMIKENLVAERIAIDSYRDFIQYLGEQDSTTRRML